MPGPEGYGEGGKWVHDRAHRIMEKGDVQEKYGPEKGKQVAYAIATQQAHAVGKSPKDFRTPQGVHEAKQKYDEPKSEYQKTAASSLIHNLLKGIPKQGRTRIRIHNILKKLTNPGKSKLSSDSMTRVNYIYGILKAASVAGQDLRVKPMGGTKFPTADSTSLPNSLLNQSRSSAEFGPSPAAKNLSGKSIKDMTPDYGTTKGDLPMAKGASMRKLENDPLIVYLRKQAEGLKEELGAYDNGVVMPTSPVDPIQFSEEFLNNAVDHRDKVLRELFDNAASAKRRGL